MEREDPLVDFESRSSDDELKKISDASLDIPEKLHAEMYDAVITKYNVANLPTGSLIVSRGSCLTILYHSNDMNCHCSILVWCTYDGSDRFSLHHEPGRTRPMIFELDTYLYETKDYVTLLELGTIVRSNEHAYRPRAEVLSHPRYLEVIEKLVRILPLAHLSNDTDYGFMHKWQPNYWRKPEDMGYTNVRDYYYQLATEENPMIVAYRRICRVSSTCVDLIINFISILHEELYIHLTSGELALGAIPARKRLLIDVDDYDVSRLLRPSSEMYKIYETEPAPFLKGAHTHPRRWDVTIFFGPFMIAALFFVLLSLYIKPISFLMFGVSK